MEKEGKSKKKDKGALAPRLEALSHRSGDETCEELRELLLGAIDHHEEEFEDLDFQRRLEGYSPPKKNIIVEHLESILNFIDEILPQIKDSENGLSWLAHLEDLEGLITKTEKNIEDYNCDKNPLKKLRKHFGRVHKSVKATFDPKPKSLNLSQVPWTNPSTSSNAVARVPSATATTAVNSLNGTDAVPINHNFLGADLVNHGVGGGIFDSSQSFGISTMRVENSSDGGLAGEEADTAKAMTKVERDGASHDEEEEGEEDDEEEEEEEDLVMYIQNKG
jgi:hypothetical protein